MDGTNTLLMKYDDNKFVLYDFLNDSNKQINLDNDKYNDFNLKNNSVVFSGTYADQGVEYELRASITLDKLMEAYEIKSIGEAEEATDTEGTDADSTEETENTTENTETDTAGEDTV